MRYAVKLVEHDGSFIASCRDLPAFNSVGDSADEALAESVDGLVLALEAYVDARQMVPAASEKKRGEHWVDIPPLDVAKIGLYEAMLARGMRKADLARVLGVHAPQVDRLLSLTHQSRLDQLESALKRLGYRINLSVERFGRTGTA